MENNLVMYEGQLAIAKTSGTGYKVTSPLTGTEVKLIRDVDFGVIPRTKQPSLFKSGAEKVAMAYGLMQRYTVEHAIEQITPEPFFYYRVRCDLVKIANNGQEYVFCSGYGASNTSEKRNGSGNPFDGSNSTLKMAQKRSLVQAALAVSGLSSMFTQDMENENFMKGFDEITAEAKSPFITKPQGRRLFTIGTKGGLTVPQIKEFLKDRGIDDPTKILKEQYDAIIEDLQKEAELAGEKK